MNRFEEASDDVESRLRTIISDKFPSLRGCHFEIVMDTKKRKSGGKHVLVKLDKASPILRHITTDDLRPDGADYFLYVDKTVYRELEVDDRNKVLAHALHHTDLDFDKENPYGVRKPTVQTFYEEIEDYEGDPRWAERLELIAEGVYEREEESEEA